MAITLVFDRRVLASVLAATGLGLVLSLAAPQGAFHGPVLEDMSMRQLDDLALLADLRSDSGAFIDEMDVQVVREGGSDWAGAAVESAVESSPYFAEGNSRHLLRVEAVQTPHALGLQLHLWRQGWELRVPDPSSARVQPWMAVLAAGLGALLGGLARRFSVGLIVAGIVAQLLLGMTAMPAEVLPPEGWWAEVQSGPLVHVIRALLAPLRAFALPVASAVIAFSLVLIAFDHRRSAKDASSMGLGTTATVALVGTGGAVLWIEAASRSGLLVSAGSSWGALVLVALVAAWVPVAWVCGAERAR